MNNFTHLRLHYAKQVNTVTKHGLQANQTTAELHTMKYKEDVQLVAFYAKHEKLFTLLANESLLAQANDLMHYENWLGSNGVTRY